MLFGFFTRALQVTVQPFELLCGFVNGLVSRPLLGGHGPGDGFNEFVLHMKHVG